MNSGAKNVGNTTNNKKKKNVNIQTNIERSLYDIVHCIRTLHLPNSVGILPV